ncbi:50S ribosomal protein L13 [Halorhabdus sp. CBA1104]|uniref:50S ribosomal protein L13 n=1 Tax=unclassified Halorhabdus TaxID=2621901 RepID=UPI0012B1FA34|nr:MULTISPECIES: 50S ribosomal protein L13 [unclassified Halorhabdus]QGN07120.1 50S ribosomal protein L13 [Halorhabdus sp. CBA1104]
MSIATIDADIVVDARDCIMGRVASQVAERAMDGETIAVVNAEHAVITGDDQDVFETYKKRTDVGNEQGRAYPKRPDGILKRAIRGMVPHKKQRGREAFENVRVYMGNPYDEDPQVLEGTSLNRLSNIRFVQLGDLSARLGAKVTW